MKFWFHTFGCRVNQYETQLLRERMLAGAAAEGVASWESADICVINTCTVTRAADREALALVRRISRRNPVARLVVTGCLASREPQSILREAPAALVVGNDGKQSLPALLGCQAAPPMNGVGSLEGRSRAFVKVQDGCNMSCAFCIIPSVRPRIVCKPCEELEVEVGGLVAAGHGEVVLCGIRLGRYLVEDGKGRRVDFVSLLDRVLALSGDFRLRLSSLEITDVNERLLSAMAGSGGRICPSLHLPLQSGCDAVLKRMNRWYSADFYERRVEAARARLPAVALFADVMAGFPGETDRESDESLGFIRRLGLSGLHVFRYSRRSGTSAARRRDQVHEALIVERAARLRALDKDLRVEFAARAVGSVRRVFMERDRRKPEGLSEDFLSLSLDDHPGPGFHRVRVTRSEGPAAFAVPVLGGLRAQGAGVLWPLRETPG